MTSKTTLGRRTVLQSLAATGAAATLALPAFAQPAAMLTRKLPRGEETLPVIGLGTWITFNVGNDPQGRAQSAEVMREFFAAGGRVIDSSPMYGSSQSVIGEGLKKLAGPKPFAATKIWTSSASAGPGQVDEASKLWGVEKFDLLQVHNLLAWERHLQTLFKMKDEGRVRYVGVTTSHGMRHAEMEKVMASQPVDFIQISYNPVDREIERRILPLAAERGIAVIVNRPFREGELIDAVMKHKLPAFAAEIDCANWAQLLLKFVIAHPTVTCVIPATSRAVHVRENMGAGLGRLPDDKLRARISAHVSEL